MEIILSRKFAISVSSFHQRCLIVFALYLCPLYIGCKSTAHKNTADQSEIKGGKLVCQWSIDEQPMPAPPLHKNGDTIQRGLHSYSPNQRYFLGFNSFTSSEYYSDLAIWDLNSKPMKSIWRAGATKDGAKPDRFVIQGDGNMVGYEGDKAVWSTNTDFRDKSRYNACLAGHPPCKPFLTLQNDGNLVLYCSYFLVHANRLSQPCQGYRLHRPVWSSRHGIEPASWCAPGKVIP